MDSRFTGLSAFPLTPLRDDRFDEEAYGGLIRRLVVAGVDSITVLGSTGSYAYLSREERWAAVKIAVENARGVPVFAGIGALRTRHVKQFAQDAQKAGVAGVLLAPLTYQALTEDDVFGLYADVVRDLSVPLIVYDNPGTTHFTFSDELYTRIAELPSVASIKIPGVPADPFGAAERVKQLRQKLPARVSIGVSGDASAATGLIAGCDGWYSVIAGTLPLTAKAIMQAAHSGDASAAGRESDRLQPLWTLFGRYGSLRVVASIAEQFELVPPRSLPLPILGLDREARSEVQAVVSALGLHP